MQSFFILMFDFVRASCAIDCLVQSISGRFLLLVALAIGLGLGVSLSSGTAHRPVDARRLEVYDDNARVSQAASLLLGLLRRLRTTASCFHLTCLHLTCFHLHYTLTRYGLRACRSLASSMPICCLFESSRVNVGATN